MRKIKYIFVHHTASDQKNTTFEGVKKYHVEKLGWKDIGYHALVTYDGVIHQGRKDKTIGAHCKSCNRNSLGIVLTGNFNKDSVNSYQMEALIDWLVDKCKKYNIPTENILGHRDAFLKKLGKNCTNTSCPGDNAYKEINEIRRRVEYRILKNKKYNKFIDLIAEIFKKYLKRRQ